MQAYHTVLKDIDRQTKMLCKKLATVAKLEPNQKIEIAQQILMLQEDRKAVVQEIMVSVKN